MIATIVAEILGAAGVEVVGFATDGDDALELFRTLRPDGIVLDFRMPRVDGLQVARAIRAGQVVPDAHIVLMTSDIAPEVRQAAMDAGVDHFLNKGAELERLPALALAHARATPAHAGTRARSDEA